jgi:PAS domain-containing protein
MAKIGSLFLMIYLLTLLGFWFVTKPLAGRILLHANELERTIEEKTTGLEQEIDRRTELEKLLREKEQFLNSVFDAIQDGICVLSPDLKIIYTNKAMQTWYKEHLPLEDKTCFEVYHGLQHPCPDCPSLRSIKSRKIEMQEVPLIRTGCKAGVQELYAFPRYDENNQLKGVVEYIRDISLRKQAQEALKESERNMASVLTRLPFEELHRHN